MPRRRLLSAAQRATLLSIPTDTMQLARQYTLTARDRALIRAKRGAHNQLGFAIQLAYLRFPGQPMSADTEPPPHLVSFMARQSRLKTAAWADYALWDETRREHALELQAAFGYELFTVATYRRIRGWLTELALQTHNAVSLAEQFMERLRAERILLPTTDALDRICSEAVTRGTWHIHAKLVGALNEDCRDRLDRVLFPRDSTRTVTLTWLQHPPGEAKAKNILSHLDRLTRIRAVELPPGLGLLVHQDRLTELAREGALMSAQHLRDLEPMRRHALLAALVLDLEATITDQIFEMHDRVIGRLFTDAKRKHEQRFAAAGKAINDKVRLYARVGHALMDAREHGRDPYAAIEAVLPWDVFTQSVTEADELAQPASFDPLPLLAEGYHQVRRYAPRLLDTFDFRAAPVARDVLDGIEALPRLYRGPSRTVPATAPTAFLRKRWEPFVVTANGLDRPLYELATLTELKNALRSGDIWIPGSRQFKDFEDYLLPPDRFATLRDTAALPVAIGSDGDSYLRARLAPLEHKLREVDRLAGDGDLPEAEISGELLKVAPLRNSVPREAELLEEDAFACLPHVKITDVLLEVERWTQFTRHFTHQRHGVPAKDRTALLTIVLADAINLGLSKMAEACLGTTFYKLDTLRAWHVRDDTYSMALAELVNYHHRLPFAAHWGRGTTSSSDGQRFPVGGRGEHTGSVNLRYGTDPGITFYTHISDQYAPFHTKVINTTVRDATFVLDGLLYHESDWRIEEHYTDTLGFTDHVFFLCHALGFRFAPRIRDLADRRLYVPGKARAYPHLALFMRTRSVCRTFVRSGRKCSGSWLLSDTAP